MQKWLDLYTVDKLEMMSEQVDKSAMCYKLPMAISRGLYGCLCLSVYISVVETVKHRHLIRSPISWPSDMLIKLPKQIARVSPAA